MPLPIKVFVVMNRAVPYGVSTRSQVRHEMPAAWCAAQRI